MLKRISLLIVVICLVILTGCSSNHGRVNAPAPTVSPNQQVEPITTSNSANNTTPNQLNRATNGNEAGPGPLTQQNVSLGSIHIGDLQSSVLGLYGEPTSKGLAHGTPFPLWYYARYNMYVQFYSKGSQVAQDPKVEDIKINEPSSLQTEKGIGIGSSLEDILQSYEQVNGTIIDPENQTRNIWIHGSDKVIIKNGSTNLTIYYPTLTILLNQDKVTNIELSNEESEPE